MRQEPSGGDFIRGFEPELPIYIIERKQDSSPYKMIGFTNEKAIDWKVEQILGKHPINKPMLNK